MRSTLPVLLAVGIAGASPFVQSKAPQPTIQGVWQVVETTTSGPSASTNSKPQPSLYIFTARHYSQIRINGTAPRPNLPQDPAKATAGELLAVWGPAALAAQAGTYELNGGKLTIRAIVAKDPGRMAAGAFIVYSCKLDGSTLTLTQEATDLGPTANPQAWKLVRVE